MSKKKIVMLIFSKNRSCQCDLLLNSFFYCCNDENLTEMLDIFVLYKADENHKHSYEILKSEQDPFINWVEEKNFREDVLNILKDYEHVLFCTDDTIWVQSFNLNDILKTLKEYEKDHLGVSFRLGTNTNFCYPLNIFQKLPPHLKILEKYISYNWTEASGDFSYSLEVSSSLYAINDLDFLWGVDFKNPNDLERVMYLILPSFVRAKPKLLCGHNSFAFSSPSNRVQNVALLNRFGDKKEFWADNLLKLYENGYRIDYKKFHNFIPHAAHQEAEFEFIKES